MAALLINENSFEQFWSPLIEDGGDVRGKDNLKQTGLPKLLSLSQFLADPQAETDKYTAVFLVDVSMSTRKTLRVALPETCPGCGHWFNLPASAIASVIPLGQEVCCQKSFFKVALLFKSKRSQLIEMIRAHFSQGSETALESVGEAGEKDVICQSDEEDSSLEAIDTLGTTGGELSGKAWVSRFPTSRSILDLKPPFLAKMFNFNNALIKAGAKIKINATLRPPERAYLMHWSFKIAHGMIDPLDVPIMPGVDIRWSHGDLEQSRLAAIEMVQGYGIAFPPALTSNHIRGLAIDMNIAWSSILKIKDAAGGIVRIGAPRSGANTKLHKVGKSYGVIKLVSDPPHWSDNGR
jgi:hypothetical protein